MSSTLMATATSAFATTIPSGTISALIGQPPATEKDYWIVKYLLLTLGLNTDPLNGISIPPVRPTPYHFETRGLGIIVSMSIGIAFMVTITLLRLGVRIFRRGLVVGFDDLFIVPGLVSGGFHLHPVYAWRYSLIEWSTQAAGWYLLLAVAWPSLQIAAAMYGGAGKHMYDVTYEEYGVFKTCTNLSKVMFFMGVGFIKVSICLFNRRLISLTDRAWKIFNSVFLFLLFVFIMVSLFWNIFQCRPAYGGWDPIRIAKDGKKAVCQPDTVGSALSVAHIIMDFGLLAVPLIVLWKVKMGWGTKLRLYFVFCIGGISAIGSIIRQIEQGRLKSDVTYNSVPLQDWTLVDLTFGVVAASLPILSAFVPKQWKSVTGSGGTPGYGYGNSQEGILHQNSRGAYFRFTRRTGITGKRDPTDSEENIVRTDEVELTYQKRNDMSKEMDEDLMSVATSSNISLGKGTSFKKQLVNKSSQDYIRDLGQRRDLGFGQDGIISQSGHKAWVGEAK